MIDCILILCPSFSRCCHKDDENEEASSDEDYEKVELPVEATLASTSKTSGKAKAKAAVPFAEAVTKCVQPPFLSLVCGILLFNRKPIKTVKAQAQAKPALAATSAQPKKKPAPPLLDITIVILSHHA